MTTPTKQLLTAREVAELLGIGLRTVWRWTVTGQLPAPVRQGRQGRVVRWRVRDLKRFIRRGDGGASKVTAGRVF